MALNTNPFFLLKLPCTAGRREIVSACEEMSFMLDSETCSNAQNELINLNKRLSAEINWFVDAEEITIDRIRSNIENNKPILTDGLSPLSTLNATIYNFSLSSDSDPYELEHFVMDIDGKFSALNVGEITEAINRNRSAAKLGSVQTQDVTAELGKKREEIRQCITEKLAHLDQDTYVALITMLAEKCLTENSSDDDIIIADAVDQYEVRMQATLEEKTEAIVKHINEIRAMPNNTFIPAEIILLIGEVNRWDILAQPLQIKSQTRGMPQKISMRLGSKLRGLSFYLHNKKGLTKEALTLVNAMKPVFAELDGLADQFEADSGTLNNLLKEQKKSEVFVDEFDSLQKEAEDIKLSPTQSKAVSFVDHIRRLNRRIKALDLDADMMTELREHLCLLGRGTAIDLHNASRQTANALFIIRMLVEEFGDLSSLRTKLNEDAATLTQQLLLYGMNQTTPTFNTTPPSVSYGSSNNKGCMITVLVIAAIIVIVSFASNTGPSRKPSSSSSYSQSRSSASTSIPTTRPTTIPAIKTEEQYSTSSTVGDNVFVNIVLIEPEYGVYTSEVGKAVKPMTMYDDYVCRCTTDIGKTVWISFDAVEYSNKIDPTIDLFVSDATSGFGGEHIYFSPVAKLHGKVVEATSIMSGLDIKLGRNSIIEYSSIEIPKQIDYRQNTTISISTIIPSYTITSGSSKEVTHVLCEYNDSLGKADWIYMSVNDYIKYFDPKANPATGTYASEKKYLIAKKVSVTTEYADDIINGASSTIGQKTIYVFSGMN